MKLVLSIGFVIIYALNLRAQTPTENVEGVVSFISSQNVYIKFKTTSGIAVGDTLYTFHENQLSPSMIVKNLSSTSVMCSPIISYKLNINEIIIAKRRVEISKHEIKKEKKDSVLEIIDTTKLSENKNLLSHLIKQKISGRIAISDFTNFSNTPAKASNVVNYSFSLNALNIGGSKFSFESTILYRQENGQWNNVQKNIFKGLKIYNLNLKYDLNNNTFVSFGRKINPSISNMGAMDGLQAEKRFKNFFVGGFVGSRPNYNDYSFDINLFQYGGYVGHNVQTPKLNMQNSFAIVEQTNNSKTDRRFIYFQHSNSIVKNVYVFYTLECDLYKIVNEQKQNALNLANTYFSLRYRPFKKVTISASYDARKNVIYYETDKNYLSTLIESETRQGVGLQTNYTITKHLYVGAKAGYRFQKKDFKPTKNAYAFVSHNNLFKSGITTTLSWTILETTYLNGKLGNLRFSKGFNSEKTTIGLGYSFVDYKIRQAELPLIQHIVEFNATTELINKMSLSIHLETDVEKLNQFYRVYLQLRKRF